MRGSERKRCRDPQQAARFAFRRRAASSWCWPHCGRRSASPCRHCRRLAMATTCSSSRMRQVASHPKPTTWPCVAWLQPAQCQSRGRRRSVNGSVIGRARRPRLGPRVSSPSTAVRVVWLTRGKCSASPAERLPACENQARDVTKRRCMIRHGFGSGTACRLVAHWQGTGSLHDSRMRPGERT